MSENGQDAIAVGANDNANVQASPDLGVAVVPVASAEMSTAKVGTAKGKTSRCLSALRNGTRMSRLTLGELPRELTRVKVEGRQYRRDLEHACFERHGEISIVHAHKIDAAVAHQTHAAICRWLFNHRLELMSVTDIVKCSANMANAREARNRAINELDLEMGEQDEWQRIDSILAAQRASPGGHVASDHGTNTEEP